MRRIISGITPITLRDIDVEDGNYLRRALEQIWQELPLLMLGALLLAAACLPAALLLQFRLPLLGGGAALLSAVPAWTAYCHLAGRIAVGRSTSLRAVAAAFAGAFAGLYWRSVVLAAPLLAMVYLFAATRSSLAGIDGSGGDVLGGDVLGGDVLSVVLTAAETVQLLAVLAAGSATVQALALLAAFDLPLRSAANNSLLILLARPWVVLGLAGFAYLLALAARPFGPGTWLLGAVLYTLFQVNATLMVSKQLLDAQQAHMAVARLNGEEEAK